MGPDTDTLRDIADRVKGVLQASPMMRTVNTDWGSRVPTLHFTLDQDRLQATGLTSMPLLSSSSSCYRAFPSPPCGKIFARCR